MRKINLRQILNVLAVLAVIVVNVLANALPINGQNTGDISDRFDIYFVPAGYVFSIWGLIYLALVAFAVYQCLPAQRDNPRLARIGNLFVLSSLANIVWIFLWHYEQFALTVVAMLILLISLVFIYLRLEIGASTVSEKEKWLVRVPFSIYLGWITVATVANITNLLDFIQWNGWGISEEVWAVIMFVIAGGIASAVTLTRRDIAYMLVILWAYVGIAVKHAGVPFVATTAWIVTVLLALILVAGIYLNRREKEPQS